MNTQEQHRLLRIASAELPLPPSECREEMRRAGQLDSEYRITFYGRVKLAHHNRRARAIAKLEGRS